MNTPNVDAGRLERRVRLLSREKRPGINGFCPFHHSAEPVHCSALRPFVVGCDDAGGASFEIDGLRKLSPSYGGLAHLTAFAMVVGCADAGGASFASDGLRKLSPSYGGLAHLTAFFGYSAIRRATKRRCPTYPAYGFSS